MNGKSESHYILAQAHYLHNPSVRIGCTSEEIYNRLKDVIPEANLIKCWERVEDEISIIWEEM